MLRSLDLTCVQVSFFLEMHAIFSGAPCAGEEGGEEASRTEVEGTLRQERDVRV
jgi:hypothetical protein